VTRRVAKRLSSSCTEPFSLFPSLPPSLPPYNRFVSVESVITHARFAPPLHLFKRGVSTSPDLEINPPPLLFTNNGQPFICGCLFPFSTAHFTSATAAGKHDAVHNCCIHQSSNCLYTLYTLLLILLLLLILFLFLEASELRDQKR